jgi:hypothetical protein
MTVDQLPLPSAAIWPLPLPPWSGTGDERDRFGAEGPATNRPRQEEQPITPSGWPRVFPGL